MKIHCMTLEMTCYLWKKPARGPQVAAVYLSLLTCSSGRCCRMSLCFVSQGVLRGCSGWSWSRVTWAHSLVLQQEQLLLGCCCCGKQLCRRQRGYRCSLGWRRGWWESTLGSGQDAQAWLLAIKQNWSIDWSIHPERTKTSHLFCPQRDSATLLSVAENNTFLTWLENRIYQRPFFPF